LGVQNGQAGGVWGDGKAAGKASRLIGQARAAGASDDELAELDIAFSAGTIKGGDSVIPGIKP